MRTPATAAREAVEGKDETLWQACWNQWDERTREMYLGDAREEFILCEILRMSPEERRLYDIQEEQ